MEKLLCECCNKNESIVVCSSAFMPSSHRYCKECLSKEIEPLQIVKAILACLGYKDVNDEAKKIIDISLDFYGIDLEKLEMQVKKEEEEYYKKLEEEEKYLEVGEFDLFEVDFDKEE